ncbi:MAG: acyltransferase family protein [Hyphomonas sp.]
MTERRYDLDWLRIAAFALLTLYHCGMFYVSWDWHVKSSRASPLIEPLMLLANPWRLGLLFLISGAATRFMADKMPALPFLGARMRRLWPPLLLAIFVIVPPQSYYEIVEALGPGSPALEGFYQNYVTGTGAWCDADGCLATPTYNHMWFVAYLILYTLALVTILPLLRRLPGQAMARLLSGPGIFLVPWLFLFLARAWLFPIFGQTHDFREDWYLHTVYFGLFLLGFGIAKHQPFFEAAVRLRWPMLSLALSSWAIIQTWYTLRSDVPADWELVFFRGIREAQAWSAMLAALGFFHRHFRDRDTPLRRTLSAAIFPFYLIHQTLIVIAGHYLDRLGLPIVIEAGVLIGLTALGCWLFYETGRRAGPLRIWIGLASGEKEPAALQRAGQRT